MLSRPFLTRHDVAELPNVREQTVRAWIRHHELRAVRLGCEFRVAVKDLNGFVNEHAIREPRSRDEARSEPA